MKVLLTQSEAKLDGLEPLLTSLNLSVVHRPLIKISFINTAETLSKAKELLKLPWLLFTSQNAIEAWKKLGLPFTNKIGVVGKATAKRLERYSKIPDLIAEPQNAKGLLSSFLNHQEKDCPVGIVKGNLSLEILEKGLQKESCQTKSIVVYKTQVLAINEDADIVLLASPSAAKALPENLFRSKLVAIGPSTAKALEDRNLSYFLAKQASIESIAKTIEGII